MEIPLFSVLLLNYRSGAYLFSALESILAQDYPALELIVSDDGSPDFDAAAVKSFIRSHARDNLKCFLVLTSCENRGTVQNLNIALSRARGTYLKSLGADDALYDTRALTLAAHAVEESGAMLLAARVMKCGSTLSPLAPLHDDFLRALPSLTPREVWQKLCVHNDLPAAGVFFTRAFFDRYGMFDEHYRLLEDWPTWLRITRLGCPITFGDFFAACYRVDSGCATAINDAYLADKRETFAREIRPYRRELGTARYLLSLLNLRMRDSRVVRKLYGYLFRRN